MLLGNLVRTACLVVIAVCVAGAALAMLKHLLTPLFAAIFLFFLMKPAVNYLERGKAPPWVIVSFFVLVSTLVVVILVQVIYSNVREFEERIPAYRQKAITVIESYYRMTGTERPPAEEKGQASGVGGQEPGMEEGATGTEPPQVRVYGPPVEGEETPVSTEVESEIESADKLREVLAQDPPPLVEEPATLSELINIPWQDLVEYAFGTAFGFLEGALMALFYLVFMFIEASRLPRRIQRGFPQEEVGHYLSVGRSITQSIERYVALKTYINLGLAVSTGALCFFFRLDFWFLWAVVMFLANYITYLGSVAALIPPIVLAYLQFNPWAATFLTLLLLANRLFWIDYVEIRFLGRQLNVSPLILLFSIALFGFLWGAAGMVLAVPLVTSIKIILSHFENTRRYAVLMSEE